MKTLSTIVLCLAVSLSFSLGIHAQEKHNLPASKTLATVPFLLSAENIVLVKGVLVGHSDTLNFILDTGSSGISLDSMTASQLGLKPEISDINIRGIAGIRKARFLYNQQLALNGFVIDSLNFHINNYEFLSYVYGARIDGVIGYSLFSRYIVKLDYDNNTMQICSPGAIRYPRGGYLLRPSIHTLPLQSAQIKDNRQINTRLLYDVGAGPALVLSQDFERDSAAIRPSKPRYPVLAHGIGGKLDMEITTVRKFRLGPYRFRHVPTMVFDDAYNVTSYPHLGGIIGNQLLKRFNTVFNYKKREIHLKPNSLYREPFERAYSGMELYYVNGLIIIGSIVAGSPAEAAGLKVDDVVISVNNNANQNFVEYKKALISARRRVNLIILRENELIEVHVKLLRLR